jgi:RNA polymerase sigma-70 factor (ECF subfamily)
MPDEPPEGPPTPPAASFEKVYSSEFKFVWHALWRLGIPNRDLPDLTHRVLVIALLSWMDYDPTRPLKPWLLGIVHRIATDYHRLARHTYEQFVPNEMLDVVDDSTDTEDLLIKRELCALVETLGRQLPGDRRRIFVQHDLEGIPIPEIARSMNIAVNTAYSRLRLARQAIRRQLERQIRSRGRLRGMHFLAFASELRDRLAKLRQGLARAPRWLARGLIAAVAISVAGIFPGGPLAEFPPAETAFEWVVIPSAQPVAPMKPPAGLPSRPEPPAPPAASAPATLAEPRAALSKKKDHAKTQ